MNQNSTPKKVVKKPIEKPNPKPTKTPYVVKFQLESIPKKAKK